MNEFVIKKVDRSRSQAVEPLGSKPKFWFREGEKRLLFKADDRGTGEDWAEVVAAHLCDLIGLPHVQYELASEYDGPRFIRPGVVCENMARRPLVLVLGNQLLLTVDPSYPQAQRFRVRQHTVDAVCDVLATLAPTHESPTHLFPELSTGLDTFIGYVMLDTWIANQDRHHENWGALTDGEVLRLAPTFDHGAALARNLSDGERRERLTTKDRNRTISTFVEKGRSAFYASPSDTRSLLLIEAFRLFRKRAPDAAKFWLGQLESVTSGHVQAILDRVPTERMSSLSKQFTAELLHENQRRLLA